MPLPLGDLLPLLSLCGGMFLTHGQDAVLQLIVGLGFRITGRRDGGNGTRMDGNVAGGGGPGRGPFWLQASTRTVRNSLSCPPRPAGTTMATASGGRCRGGDLPLCNGDNRGGGKRCWQKQHRYIYFNASKVKQWSEYFTREGVGEKWKRNWGRILQIIVTKIKAKQEYTTACSVPYCRKLTSVFLPYRPGFKNQLKDVTG